MQAYAKRLQTEMYRKTTTAENPFWTVLQMSIGYTIQKDSLEQQTQLFERADKVLYTSKDKGRNMITYLPPDSD